MVRHTAKNCSKNMDKMIEGLIDRSIERVFQSWFIENEKRCKLIVATFDYLSRIYDIIKSEPDKKGCSVIELMKLVGLNYGKVYKNGKRISYYTLEESVHDSLAYFISYSKEYNLL